MDNKNYGLHNMDKDYDFTYDIKNGSVIITGVKAGRSVLEIPSKVYVQGIAYPVKEIGKKAFSGCKGIREVALPASVESIGDWAFAKCTSLRSIIIPKMSESCGDFSLGRKVFDGCINLEKIVMLDSSDNYDTDAVTGDCDNNKLYEDISFLAAALTAKLPGEYLLHDEDIGSSFWFEKWDLALINYLKTGDYEGYTDTVLCGEEDISYDGIGSVDGELLGETYEYVKSICKAKSYLCFVRLVHDSMLTDGNRALYMDYIKSHSKGTSNEAAWLVIRDSENDETDYIKMYVSVMGDTDINIDDILTDIPEDKIKMRNYLISLGKKEEEEDIFDLLKL